MSRSELTPSHATAFSSGAKGDGGPSQVSAGAGAGRSSAATGAGRHEKTPEEAIRDTLESIVIAFVLAFVFRAFVVEAFIIPTGSMAPTLLGEHIPVRCVQCGYLFKADSPTPGRVRASQARCPMCQYANPIAAGTPTSPGDRILVHKYIYSVSEPRRWDVIVFKNPLKPHENFIKRLVGLENEKLWLIEGNVYTQPLPEAGEGDDGGTESSGQTPGWSIARKTDPDANPHWAHVQRAVWQPVYYSRYTPRDGGTEPDGEVRWRLPWVVEAGEPAAWRFEGARGYACDAASTQTIRFDFGRVNQQVRTWYPYNQLRTDRLSMHPIEDLRLAATVRPRGEGLAVELASEVRLDPTIDAQAVRVAARIDEQGNAVLIRHLSGSEVPYEDESISHTAAEAAPAQASTAVLAGPVEVGPLQPGRERHLELWIVDQELLLWVDGRVVLRYGWDVPIDVLTRRRPLPTGWTPQTTISLAGAPASLFDVQVDRDIYYETIPRNGQDVGVGTLAKSSSRGRFVRPQGEPVELDAAQFYCLGDNSPMSSDSRYWTGVDPWIYRAYLSDDATQIGVVPRELIMGRAFFVYFPAPYRLARNAWGIIPNFGEMRFIH